MKFFLKLLFLILTFLCLGTNFFSLQAQESINPLPTGFAILKKQSDLNVGYKDISSRGTMTLMNPEGQINATREFNVVQTEKNNDTPETILIQIIKPADLMGAALLSLIKKNNEKEQWIYLPNLKQTKRIVGGDQKGRFLGSEFSYEDLIPPQWENFNYQLIKISSCGNHDCYQVNQETKDPHNSSYARIVSLIRIDNYQTVQADFFDAKNRPVKQASFEDFKLINNYFWRPYKIVMKDLRTQKQTILTIDQLKMATGLKSDDVKDKFFKK